MGLLLGPVFFLLFLTASIGVPSVDGAFTRGPPPKNSRSPFFLPCLDFLTEPCSLLLVFFSLGVVAGAWPLIHVLVILPFFLALPLDSASFSPASLLLSWRGSLLLIPSSDSMAVYVDVVACCYLLLMSCLSTSVSFSFALMYFSLLLSRLASVLALAFGSDTKGVSWSLMK